MDSTKVEKAGDVVLVEKEMADKPNVALALKPKRPLSDLQKANLDKLIERNRLRREETKKQAEIYKESLPEAEKPIKVKRNYKQDIERKVVADRLSSLEELVKGFSTSFQKEAVVEKVAEPPTQWENKKKPRKPVKPKRPATPTTTDCETETETEAESTDTERKNKYVKKATQRLETVKQIQQQLTNRYSNMSIF